MRTLRIGMRGNDVMEIQALLKKMGYNIDAVDGIFGPQMRDAVIEFQERFGLTPDGVIGPNTNRVLERLLSGYDLYVIRPGDTFYAIAQKYGTRPELIETANPDQNPQSLRVGQRIVVPYSMDVVDTELTISLVRVTFSRLRKRVLVAGFISTD